MIITVIVHHARMLERMLELIAGPERIGLECAILLPHGVATSFGNPHHGGPSGNRQLFGLKRKVGRSISSGL